MEEVKKEEVKGGQIEQIKLEKEVIKVEETGPFVTENDTFDVVTKYYKIDKKIIVEDVDDDFDTKNTNIKTLICTFKYPSQADSSIIGLQSRQINNSVGKSEFGITDYIQLELYRLLTLIRKWNLKDELNNASVMNLNPKIIKAITSKIRIEIGTEGII